MRATGTPFLIRFYGWDTIDCDMTEFELADGLLDNTQVIAGRYIAHIAVPCRALEEAARWYSEVLGAQPVRILKDRVTFSFGGVLQLVCHLERRALEVNPRAYPRHFGLTFLHDDDFSRMREHVERLGIKFVVRPMVRFGKTPHELLIAILRPYVTLELHHVARRIGDHEASMLVRRFAKSHHGTHHKLDPEALDVVAHA